MPECVCVSIWLCQQLLIVNWAVWKTVKHKKKQLSPFWEGVCKILLSPASVVCMYERDGVCVCVCVCVCRFLKVLKYNWWKYLVLGVVDVEANFVIVLAYRYTNLTSIQVHPGRGRETRREGRGREGEVGI